MIPRFSDAMRLDPLDAPAAGRAFVFQAVLNENWTIGPKVHGGLMVALCAKAAIQAYLADAADSEGSRLAPVAVSANFLSAPDAGPVRVVATVRKRGRRIGLVDVELVAGERTCVDASVTLGSLGRGEPLLVDEPAAAMSRQPPADLPPIGPGHPGPRSTISPGAATFTRRRAERIRGRSSASGCVPKRARSTNTSR